MDEGCIPEAASLGGAADGEVEEQASISSQDAAVEKQVQDTASSEAVPPDNRHPHSEFLLRPAVFQEENPMPVQEGAGGKRGHGSIANPRRDASAPPRRMPGRRCSLRTAGRCTFSQIPPAKTAGN